MRGDVGERMMRYAFALAHRDDGVGVIGDVKELCGMFPALPRLESRNRGIVSRIAGVSSGDVTRSEWMDYANVDALGDKAAEYFAVSRGTLPREYADIAATLAAGETVAVHILSAGSKACTCTPDYYNWAIAGMRSWLDNPRFVVIADDERWARRNLHFGDAAVVWKSLSASRHGLVFDVLRLARHNIACNTLASWWGAWLNKNPDKIVVIPKEWQYGADSDGLKPFYWTIIPTK